jgi:predicted metal-binding protein
MTQQEFSRDIIAYLTKENTIEELIKLSYEEAQLQHLLPQPESAEESTLQSEEGQLRLQQFMEMKVEFLLEAVIISKQMESEKPKQRFFEKIFKSGFMEMATDFMERGVLKALDFFNCLAQLVPLKFIEYLKTKYR